MSRPVSEQKIRGREYSCEKLPATQAIELQARLLKLLGPGLSSVGDIAVTLGGLSAALRDGGGAPSGQIEPIARAVSAVAKECEPRDVASLMADLVRLVKTKRPSGMVERCDLDEFELSEAYLVAAFALRTQFSGLFSGAPGGA